VRVRVLITRMICSVCALRGAIMVRAWGCARLVSTAAGSSRPESGRDAPTSADPGEARSMQAQAAGSSGSQADLGAKRRRALKAAGVLSSGLSRTCAWSHRRAAPTCRPFSTSITAATLPRPAPAPASPCAPQPAGQGAPGRSRVAQASRTGNHEDPSRHRPQCTSSCSHRTASVLQAISNRYGEGASSSRRRDPISRRSRACRTPSPQTDAVCADERTMGGGARADAASSP
jgi:hypothetical protein